MNIGILTEDEKSGAALHETMREEGHECTLHANAQEAMARILNEQSNAQPSYDVLIVDLCLQGSIDGAEFIKRVREMLPNTPTKFILMADTHAAGYQALVSKHLFDVHFLRGNLPTYDVLRLIEQSMRKKKAETEEKPVEPVTVPEMDEAAPQASPQRSIAPHKAPAKKKKAARR